MRIIRGKLQNHKFNPPKGFPSRPTTDFAKEGLFNVLENRIDFESIKVLDLFSGTGNITFEFASREAKEIVSVDKNYKCTRFIKSFIKEYKLENQVSVFHTDSLKFIDNYVGTFDLIFADPPFEDDIHNQLIEKVMNSDILAKEGWFILEHGKHNSFSEGKGFQFIKSYGNVVFSFFQHNSL